MAGTAWTLYEGYTPFHYALNSPVLLMDKGGKWVQAMSEAAQNAIRNSLPGDLGSKLTFSNDGFVDRDKLRELATSDNASSNLDALSWLADRDETIQVAVSKDFDVKLDGKSSTQTFYTAGLGESKNDKTLLHNAGIALIDKPDSKEERKLPTSTNGLIQVFINPAVGTSAVENQKARSKGQVAAHEMYVHILTFLMRRAGKTTDPAWHKSDGSSAPSLQKVIEKAESEAK